MSDRSNIISIPVDSSGLFRPDETKPVRGGGTRLVPLVPIDNAGNTLPCIWRSHEVVEITKADGSKGRGNHCLLLANRNPPLVLPADVDLDAWPTFGEGPVEW
jgi:hypothetical protein